MSLAYEKNIPSNGSVDTAIVVKIAPRMYTALVSRFLISASPVSPNAATANIIITPLPARFAKASSHARLFTLTVPAVFTPTITVASPPCGPRPGAANCGAAEDDVVGATGCSPALVRSCEDSTPP